jgi:hypothetical protein
MFDIKDYLLEAGWTEKHDGFYAKGFKTIKLVGLNGNAYGLLVAMNFDKRVKHKHIVTCRTPVDKFEADVLFDLTMLLKAS